MVYISVQLHMLQISIWASEVSFHVLISSRNYIQGMCHKPEGLAPYGVSLTGVPFTGVQEGLIERAEGSLFGTSHWQHARR